MYGDTFDVELAPDNSIVAILRWVDSIRCDPIHYHTLSDLSHYHSRLLEEKICHSILQKSKGALLLKSL